MLMWTTCVSRSTGHTYYRHPSGITQYMPPPAKQNPMFVEVRDPAPNVIWQYLSKRFAKHHVLDLGGGTGIQNDFASYTNVDDSISRILECRKRCPSSHVVCTPLQTESPIMLPRTKYDVVVACRVANIVPPPILFRWASHVATKDKTQFVVIYTNKNAIHTNPLSLMIQYAGTPAAHAYSCSSLSRGVEHEMDLEMLEDTASQYGWMLTEFVADCSILTKEKTDMYFAIAVFVKHF